MKSFFFHALNLLLCFFIFNNTTIVANTIDTTIIENCFKSNASNAYANFELFINTGTAKKSTRVFYIAGKTTDFDNGYDSKIFSGVAVKLALYTKFVSSKKDRKLSIQTVPNEYEKMVIPVGLIIGANKEITFSVVSKNFPENLNIYLEDRLNNTFINLSKQTYTYKTTATTSGVGQFFIHTSTNLPSPPNTALWTGITNTDWHTFSNWFSNTVPTTTADVIIPSDATNYPTANSAVTFNSLLINSGASFIPKKTAIGIVTYKRAIATTNWHLIAAPVTGENTKNLIEKQVFATGSGNNIGIGTFINNGNIPWNYATATTANQIISGAGIAVKLKKPGELSITGTANTNTINYPITTGSRNNFNFIGNPFPAYLNSEKFALQNTNVLNAQTIWLWNGTQYVTYNANNPIEISPGQGFFVEANSNATINFDISNQSHQTSDTFKRPTSKTSFELFVANETVKKSTKVFYIANKNTGFDNGYDSKIFGGIKSAGFDVFTELVAENKGDKLAIQTLPNTNMEAMIIPLGIIAKAGEKVIFSVNTQNFSSDVKIYLEDRIANTFTNISQKNYKVTLEKEAKGTGQFYIHTNSKNLAEAPTKEISQNVTIYKSINNSITISGLQTQNASLDMYSILGQKIISTSFKSTGIHVIELPKIAKGVYIIKLNSDLGKLHKKIILD
ncbi:T9SS type A sorting domain-containing protein [Tenacibaculum finnmarkense genomovar finnmarkense]|uniref:T9SS type A sorting domain-containing protein n=1 Tax=Tenacibaculum finnmarkense TaxID=2781243 RepID=UPI001E5DDE48|nr:T9SS type A sorting domain-containing protein [Tenacibaculum finnmarkense]MCD8417654.1 T9SS type A sorting domain-containing protein [Tenacibaculum finnmarkense genomovar finnmarkense]MCG8186097.1 T9SS type A sorting domain-containing protein [Tenacibaculum finnmarkense genomovar finnmarkense]MCG8202650.1 T9SS type A sorting domain-containing protein [Tenacibaculum finnmarkense genomovar finnmarkense]MCG8210044.1 T9SS type A sorting domain-containing protein [Tenacibaculum finnmarkense genom